MTPNDDLSFGEARGCVTAVSFFILDCPLEDDTKTVRKNVIYRNRFKKSAGCLRYRSFTMQRKSRRNLTYTGHNRLIGVFSAEKIPLTVSRDSYLVPFRLRVGKP
ncbi:hypothetical protein CEXT_493061 [Caerostris extrusa]|uniref:Uncharacterized protein n=1 Tax=Caerostris extrusa TaxID=172846 RepID=A0AAV4RCE8_CAEEX|nr:hypothetical protein CEXT_493061 [Caerostris extrusa]